MAQRTIHLAFGDYVAKHMAITDKNRFLLGNILPDAFSDRKYRENTHYKKFTDDQSRIYFDFRQFAREFSTELAQDDLYLGYYLHLIEDVYYRQFLHNGYDFWQQIKTMDDVNRLHQDYHLLNTYLVQAYGLEDTVTLPVDFDREPLHRIALFDAPRFLRELHGDYYETVQGSTTLLTEDILDRFFRETMEPVLEEAKKARAGDFSTDPLAFAWVPATANPLVS